MANVAPNERNESILIGHCGRLVPNRATIATRITPLGRSLIGPAVGMIRPVLVYAHASSPLNGNASPLSN